MRPELGLMRRRVPPNGTIDRHSSRLIGRRRRDRLVRISYGRTSKATSMAIAILKSFDRDRGLAIIN
jgi:hypothetical protein